MINTVLDFLAEILRAVPSSAWRIMVGHSHKSEATAFICVCTDKKQMPNENEIEKDQLRKQTFHIYFCSRYKTTAHNRFSRFLSHTFEATAERHIYVSPSGTEEWCTEILNISLHILFVAEGKLFSNTHNH